MKTELLDGLLALLRDHPEGLTQAELHLLTPEAAVLLPDLCRNGQVREAVEPGPVNGRRPLPPVHRVYRLT